MKLTNILIILALVFPVTILGKDSKVLLSEKEILAMTSEADDYIDSMPEGEQDRLSDAINHALEGRTDELQGFRNISKNSLYQLSEEVTIENKLIGENQCRLYEPAGKKDSSLPLLIYIPGGGLIIDGSGLNEGFCSALAQTGKMRVLSIQLPLLPENSFNDIKVSLKKTLFTILGNIKETGIDKISSVNIGAEGSSSRILIDVLSDIDNKEKNKIHSLIFYYPVLGFDARKIGSKRKFSRGYGFDYRVFESLLCAWESSDNLNFENYAFNNFPPVMIISAERDIVIDESGEFSERLKNSAKDCEWIVFEGSIHGFLSDGNQKTAFRKAIALTESFIDER